VHPAAFPVSTRGHPAGADSGSAAILSIGHIHEPFASDTPRLGFGVGAIFLVVGLLAIIVFRTASTSDQAEVHRAAKSCHQWHLAAGAAVSRLVRSTRDADLVQVNDAVFRIRRANRNCEAGWVALACQDYHAVAAGIPGHVMNRQMFPCARLEESASHRD